jgi:hypothetical protein
MEFENLFVGTTSVSPSIGTPFDIQVLNIGQSNVIIQLSSDFTTTEIALNIAQRSLFASSFGSTVTWLFVSDIERSDANIQSIQVVNAYGNSMC